MHVNNTIECSPFQQGLKRLLKQHKVAEFIDLQEAIKRLQTYTIGSSMDNHPISSMRDVYGSGSRDLHVRPNLVLVYQYKDGELELQDLLLQNLGNHDEVFPKSKKAKQAIKKALG